MHITYINDRMKNTILIVDDNVDNIDVLKAILEENYIIKATTNGSIALKIAQKIKPDVILLDVIMPGMDGYEVCRQLKSNALTHAIPVIFVTAMSEERDEAIGFEVGAIDYITKPVNPIIVKARLRTHISLANQQRELDSKVIEKTKELNNSRIDLVKTLGVASDYRDNETGLHILKMSKYSRLIANEMNMPENEAELIELASPMHDLGKIGTPDSILLKKGKLDPDEWTIMKIHTEIGSKILVRYDDDLLKMASTIARQHHERWDGNGYPDGLSGEDIDITARIVSVSDVFDALTSKRPYKDPWTPEEAYNEIVSQAGKQFDPEVIKAFSLCFDKILEVFEQYSE